MTEEKWVKARYIFQDGTVKTFGDMYEVSDQGRVRSWFKRGGQGSRANSPHVLKLWLDAYGYW